MISHYISNCSYISVYSHPNSSIGIVAKFCTSHDWCPLQKILSSNDHDKNHGEVTFPLIHFELSVKFLYWKGPWFRICTGPHLKSYLIFYELRWKWLIFIAKMNIGCFIIYKDVAVIPENQQGIIDVCFIGECVRALNAKILTSNNRATEKRSIVLIFRSSVKSIRCMAYAKNWWMDTRPDNAIRWSLQHTWT